MAINEVSPDDDSESILEQREDQLFEAEELFFDLAETYFDDPQPHNKSMMGIASSIYYMRFRDLSLQILLGDELPVTKISLLRDLAQESADRRAGGFNDIVENDYFLDGYSEEDLVQIEEAVLDDLTAADSTESSESKFMQAFHQHFAEQIDRFIGYHWEVETY